MAFLWRSKQGVGAAIFLLVGGIHALFGLIIPLGAMGQAADMGIVLFSPRTDAALFGHEPATELLETDAAFANLHDAWSTMMSGPMLALGIAEIGLVWFGARRGVRWAWGTVLAAQLALLPAWILLVRLYVAAGAPIALSDVPPFMWIPALLLAPAAYLTRPAPSS